MPPHLRDVDAAIARTVPAWKRREGVTEIRKLTLASIAAARDTIYLENQYFTAPVIAEALARRLAEPEGPEIVLISAGRSPSWFDQLTMDRTRTLAHDYAHRAKSCLTNHQDSEYARALLTLPDFILDREN